MLRLIGCVCILICGCGTGIWAGRKISNQTDQCLRLCGYLECLGSELAYNCAPLHEIAKNLAQQPGFASFSFAKLCSSSDCWGPFSEVFSNASAQCTSLFGKEVTACLQRLSGQLGNFSAENQIASISLCKRQIETVAESHRQKHRHTAKLYRTLGFLSGVTIVILLW